MLSKKFFDALKSQNLPYHKIAWQSGLSPNQLYKITAGIDRPNPNDPRIIALCEYLKMPIFEAFESESVT